jgi:hypothetical protein
MDRRDKFFSISYKSLVIVLCLLFFPSLISAEARATQKLVLSVSEICLVDISGNPRKMELESPPSDGLKPDPVKDNTTFIRYTSTVSSGGIRALTARWGADSFAPAGCSLHLKAIPSGRSNEGISRGEIALSLSPKTIVSEIGSCVTGMASGSGTQLEYTLSVQDPQKLVAGETSFVTIVFTLTDIY